MSSIRFSEQADEQLDLMTFEIRMHLLQQLFAFRDEVEERVDFLGNIFIHFIEVEDNGEVKIHSVQENNEIPKETS